MPGCYYPVLLKSPTSPEATAHLPTDHPAMVWIDVPQRPVCYKLGPSRDTNREVVEPLGGMA